MGVAILCPFGILKTIRKRGNNMKAITKGFIDTLINVLYTVCALVGYIGMIKNHYSMVVGCIAFALYGMLIKQELKPRRNK